MRSVWTFYAVAASILMLWGLWAGHRPSITFGYPIMGAVVISALSTRWLNRWIDRLPGGNAVQTAVVAVAAVMLYRVVRAVATMYGW